MTSTAQGLALADRHRVAQARLGLTTFQQIIRLYPLLVAGGRVEANTSRWLSLAVAVMTAQRAQSAALAAQFATAYRVAEKGDLDGFVPKPVLTVPREALTTSMSVLGPVAYKREVAKQLKTTTSDLQGDFEALTRDVRLPQGLQAKMAANTARAAQRHVLNGGRETLDEVIRSDVGTVGWYRTTAPNPCFFCALLASRGAVYDDDSFEESDPRFSGPGDQKVHDGCGCMLLPLYKRPSTEAESAAFRRYREYDELYRSGPPNLLAFRQAYEGRTKK